MMIIPLSFPFLHIQSYVPINSNVLSQDDSYARLTLLPRFPHQVPPSWSTTLTVPRINCTYIYIWVIINHSYLESYQDHRFFLNLDFTPNKLLVPLYQFMSVRFHIHFSVQTFCATTPIIL